MGAASSILQFSDVRVTRAKFDRQVNDFNKNASDYRKEGIICLKIEFPVLEFAFLAKETQYNLNLNMLAPEGGVVLQQIGIHRQVPHYLFSIRLDYSSFDATPPSLRIINPFTSELSSQVSIAPFITPSQQDSNSLIDDRLKTINQNILLKDNDDQLFVCLRGLREYHEHPQHNGDSWFLYRLKGKGNVLHILDQLQIYAISNLNAIVDKQKLIPFPNG